MTLRLKAIDSSNAPPGPTTQRCSRHSTDTAPEFHAKAPQTTVSEGLAQGLYVAARAGVQPMTIRTKGVDSTKAPPRPTGYLTGQVQTQSREIRVNICTVSRRC